MIVTVVKALFRIRNSITPWTVRTQLVWTHFLLWRWTFTKSGFCSVCLVLVLVGTGLGMLWRSRQVEPRLNAEIVALLKERREMTAFIGQAVGRITALKRQMKLAGLRIPPAAQLKTASSN